MRSHPLTPDEALALLAASHAEGQDELSSAELAARAQVSQSTAKRLLDALVAQGLAVKTGQSRATRYRLAAPPAPVVLLPAKAPNDQPGALTMAPPWSAHSTTVLAVLDQPLGMRRHVGYRRAFVDDYVPNISCLLPRELAETLAREGRMVGQQPAGTYARKVLEPLLVDLSWSSSRLEGNRYSLLDTEQLFRAGPQAGDPDAVMLFNHKSAIEFLIDAVPSNGLSAMVVRNLHAMLMNELLPDTQSLGAVRSTVVNITDTVYLPTQVPALLEEMLGLIIDKARQIKNPVEAAFFLWVQIAYLQPFEDGNKRCSRLAANIPLMLYNCSPLAFLEVRQADYARAMMGVYELLDVSVAVDLFAWTYRRSLGKYRVILEATSQPNPFRIRYREALGECVVAVVREGRTRDAAIDAARVAPQDREAFGQLLADELKKLTEFNFARYRLGTEAFMSWVEKGRPD